VGAMVIKTVAPTYISALDLLHKALQNMTTTAISAAVLAAVIWLIYETFFPGGRINGLFAQAAGGVFGQGFGQSILTTASGSPLIPEPQTDMIYAVITSELGLFGAVGVLLTYLLFVYRGFKVAILARDSFSKLLATGLSAVFALQVFVIVGGVTKAIPLTGVTLPFISYGGASIVANFVLLALLLLVSDRARRPVVRT